MIEKTPTSGDILISILPIHARRIYSGQKKYELRKAVPQELPRRIFLYETKNGVISGHIVVDAVLSGTPESIWDEVGTLGTTKSRFFEYFAQKSIAHAFRIGAAVEYKHPVPFKIFEGVPTPQSFLYLERYPELHNKLCERAISESIARRQSPLGLKPITDEHRPAFVRLTEKHISGSYLETGGPYAEKLLQIHDDHFDKEGIFSRRKIILEVSQKNKLVGFCVLTEKIGGSLKTGPVLFAPGSTRKGIGPKLRKQLHGVLRTVGYRKVYCTAPVSNDAAVKYLLTSGYRIEAHLCRQYHRDHNELVFGFSLDDRRGPAQIPARSVVGATRIERLAKSSPAAITFLQDHFGTHFCRMPPSWAKSQIEQAVASTQAFKPREIYLARNRETILAAAVCIRKRGGSTKLLLVSETNNVETLRKLIGAVESTSVDRAKHRKVYALVLSTDATLQHLFYDKGYIPEGVLDRPYRVSDDMVVFGKMLDT